MRANLLTLPGIAACALPAGDTRPLLGRTTAGLLVLPLLLLGACGNSREVEIPSGQDPVFSRIQAPMMLGSDSHVLMPAPLDAVPRRAVQEVREMFITRGMDFLTAKDVRVYFGLLVSSMPDARDVRVTISSHVDTPAFVFTFDSGSCRSSGPSPAATPCTHYWVVDATTMQLLFAAESGERGS